MQSLCFVLVAGESGERGVATSDQPGGPDLRTIVYGFVQRPANAETLVCPI